MKKVLVAFLSVLMLLSCAPAADKPAPTGDPEARVVAYLRDNVSPGREVRVTELYNEVFTAPEEQAAVKRLYDALFQIPAFVAMTQMNTGKIPTLQEINAHFNFKVPGTTEVLLKVLESDPRVPPFFERDGATGEIKSVNLDLVRSADRFRDALIKGSK